MKVLSNLGLICFSTLGCNIPCAFASDHSNDCFSSDKCDILSSDNWYESNKVLDEYEGLKHDSAYKAVSILKLSEDKSDASVSNASLRNLTASNPEIFEIRKRSDGKQIQLKRAGDKDIDLNGSGFFKKYKNPEYLVIFECDGITQTIHALNAEKALTNIYWNYNKDLNIWNKVNKWVGISYGCTLAGANDGSLTKANDIESFNSISDDILDRLKDDRRVRPKWYSGFTNCLFNCCVTCAKLNAENDDIDIIRDSQFDQASPKSVQRYIADYFPQYVDERLIFLQSGKDRRRIDPSYQKSYMSIINMVNETAKANKRAIFKKNLGKATSMATTIIDTVNIPVAGKIIEGINQLVTTNLKFKNIDDTEHCDAYKSLSGEVLPNGTLKLIINVDNYDGDDVNSNLQIEHKPQDNKLKYRLTINIPSLSYQDKKYDFDAGYQKIFNYLNSDKILPHLTQLFNFIHNIKTTTIDNIMCKSNIRE